MRYNALIYPFLIFFLLNCVKSTSTKNINAEKSIAFKTRIIEMPEKNKLVVNTVKKYGPEISSTYKKAVCTELVIQIL
jgi:hypothetical protein